MWPSNENKFLLVKRVADFNTKKLMIFTPGDTTVKNLNLSRFLLKYASDHTFMKGENYYVRSKKGFKAKGLLDSNYNLNEYGNLFLKELELHNAKTPDFSGNKNPFHLEILLYLISSYVGTTNYHNNIEIIFKYAKDYNIDQLDEITSLQWIFTSELAVKRYFALSITERMELKKQLEELKKELNRGKLKTLNSCRPGWNDFLEAFSSGLIGKQNDSFYRATSFLKIKILEKIANSSIKYNDSDTQYEKFKNLLTKDSFMKLLPHIKSFFKYANILNRLDKNKLDIQEDLITNTEFKIAEKFLQSMSDDDKFKIAIERLKKSEQKPILNKGRAIITKKQYENQNKRCAETKAALLIAKGYKCQICGYSFESDYGTKKGVSVHHISKINTVENNRPSNLLIVDPNCHEMIERNIIQIEKDDSDLIIKNTYTGKSFVIKQNIF